MARMPGARWLGEHSPGVAMSRYDVVCAHTIVGYAPAHAAHFSVHHDGTIDQSRDTRYRSGANLDGNHRVIAIENEDHGPAYGPWDTDDGHAVPAFTAAQVEANAQILAWVHTTHGVPLQLCPDSRSGSRGLAYHRQGIDGNFSSYAYPGRVPLGELWTKSYGKVCPGDRRISQLPAVLTRARQIVAGEDDVTPEEVKQAMREVLAEKRIRLDWDGQDVSFYQAASWIHFNAADGSFVGTVPHTSVRENRRGTDTFGKQVLDKPTAEVDVAALAAELAPLLPGCSQDTVEAALRAVLGGLDNPPPPVEPAV